MQGQRRPGTCRTRPGTQRGPGAAAPGPLCQAGAVLLDLALDRRLVDGDVVVVELVDADEGARRVVLVVERTDARGAGVVDVVAGLDGRDALRERGALGALVSTGHRSHVGLDGARVRAPALHRGERGEDDGVVGLLRVRVVGQGRARGALVALGEARLQVGRRERTGDGALGAGEGARVEVLAVVGRVAVRHVDRADVGALRDELGDDRLGLVEGEDDDRVGVRGQRGRHLGRERGLAGGELLALAGARRRRRCRPRPRSTPGRSRAGRCRRCR